MSANVEVRTNRVVSFLLRAAITSAALLFVAVFVPMLFGWKPAIITSGSMAPQLQVGDVVLVDAGGGHRHSVRDVITFDRRGQSITHRIVIVNADGTFRTQGDANGQPDSDPVAPADISGSVRAVVPLVGLPALHPQFIAGFILLLMARIVHTAAPKARKIKAIKRGVSLRWILAGDGIAMAAVTSVVATACVGTTLTSAVFVASTSSSANSFQARDGYYSTVISLSPQSYWRLGEASGASAVDTQGLLNGTYSGVTSYGTTAPLSHDSDTAVTCTSGTTCFTTADNAAFHNTGAQSIALWLKPSVAPQASNARVFAKYDGTNITYFVAYNGTSGQMRYIVDVNSRVTAISTTLLTNTNAWYFIAGTWDGSTARIYINGAQEGTAGGTGPVKQNAVGFTGMATTAGTPGAKGSLDDVAVWNRVLTPTEISTLYTRGTT